MDEIINIIKERFAEYSDIEPYTSYDAIPVRDKGHFFTVVSAAKYETSAPIYSDNYFYLPVIAEIKLTVLAPQGASANELFAYYNKHIEETVNRIIGKKNGLKNMTVAPDTVSKRLTLTAAFQLDAIKTVRRPESW